MKKTRLMFLTSTLVVLAVFAILATFLFIVWYNDTHTGQRSGKVIDAITGKPIEGAVVCYIWNFRTFMEGAMDAGGLCIYREVLTDDKGQYYVPGVYQKKLFILVDGYFEEDSLLVYKEGFAVYTTIPRPQGKGIYGTSFGYNDVQKYLKKNNIVKLFPFKEGTSHEEHILLIDASTMPIGTKLLAKELEKERERSIKEAVERRNKENERRRK